MARKQSGGLNKLLNFIGLVDDESSRDTYGEEYSSDNYGRKAAYTPPRQARPGATTRPAANQPRRLPAQPTQTRSRYDSRYDSRGSRGYDDYRAAERRAESRFDDSSYSARTPRQPSRYDAPDPRYGGNVPARVAPQRPARMGQRSRTATVEALQDAAPFVRVIGDAARVSTITNAVYWGYHAALDI